ncbi:MAG: hypothetical protein FJ137_23715, partial [Deltaproteobacteria bacterium]|nr:hypothetical protein [Deltaproteobacteria bacterium]
GGSRGACGLARACTAGSYCATRHRAAAKCAYATRCKVLLAVGNATSGTYTIDPDGAGAMAPFDATCEMTANSGGWTVISAPVARTHLGATVNPIERPRPAFDASDRLCAAPTAPAALGPSSTSASPAASPRSPSRGTCWPRTPPPGMPRTSRPRTACRARGPRTTARAARATSPSAAPRTTAPRRAARGCERRPRVGVRERRPSRRRPRRVPGRREIGPGPLSVDDVGR